MKKILLTSLLFLAGLANAAGPGSAVTVTSATVVQPTGTNLHAVIDTGSTTAATQSGTWTVQPGNIANTTAWKVDGSAVTQPVNGTVTANIGTSGSLALDATLSSMSGKLPASLGVKTSALSMSCAPSSDGIFPVTGTFWQATQPVSGTFWQATQPVSAASLPLPSGASTAAKQPALGTAGTASADVISVQGIASMTALKVDGSAVTQPVSGTVTANAGTNMSTAALALDTTLSAMSAKFPAALGGTTAANSLPVTLSTDGPFVTQTGSITETAPASDTASSGLNGRLQRIAQNQTTQNPAQNSTTSGQVGPIIQGAVTTSAPSYTTAKTNPLSLNTSGGLRVDGSGVTQPISGTATVTQATGTNLHTVIDSGTTAATQSGTWTVQPGNTANTTAWKVDGSAVTQPVSGTMTANIGTSGSLALDASVTGMSAKLPAALGVVATSSAGFSTVLADNTATGTITTQNLVSGGTATAGSAVEITLNSAANVVVQTTGTYTGALSLQGTLDGSTWVTYSAGAMYPLSAMSSFSSTIASATQGLFLASTGGALKVRITGLAAMSGTATVTLKAVPVSASNNLNSVGTLTSGQTAHSSASTGSPLRAGCRVNTSVDTTLVAGDASDVFCTTSGAVVVKPYAQPEADWSYVAASGGISNSTTAVTLNTGTASVRNYITACQVDSDALGAATELVIRDGAGGTVITRLKIGTAGLINGLQLTFPSPLKGSVGNLVEAATLTASITGAVYVNCQGYQAP